MEMELLKAKEVAKWLKLDRQTIYRLTKNGQIPHMRLGKTGTIRYGKETIDNWIREKK
jgi:excisionase family DNA binding protein